MRGLKPGSATADTPVAMSHLLQMRGLKHMSSTGPIHRNWVASFTDAWIETFNTKVTITPIIVASFTDAWIETFGGIE